MVNFARLAHATRSGFPGFLLANFATGPGLTGWIMWLALGTMVWFAVEKKRRANNGGFEKFWYSHHVRSSALPFRVSRAAKADA